MNWDELNTRQQSSLQAIYDQDQENETSEKYRWSRGSRPRPAIEWRWMYYGVLPEQNRDSPLRGRLKARKLVDGGTGSTFTALETRGYLLVQYKPVPGGDPLTYVQITPAGRRLVREAIGEQREKPFPASTLREWHWKALALAWSGRPKGVMQQYGWYGDYGKTSWRTWLHLRDYKAGALVEEYSTAGSSNASTGVRYDTHWIRLTSSGEAYYRENWLRYREMYPAIEAADPAQGEANARP